MFLSCEQQCEPKSASLQRPWPPLFRLALQGDPLCPSPRGVSLGPAQRLHLQVRRLRPEKTDPLNQGTPVLVGAEEPLGGLGWGLGPGLGGWRKAELAGGGLGPPQAQSWAGSLAAGPAPARRPARLQAAGAHTAEDPCAPVPPTGACHILCERQHPGGLPVRAAGSATSTPRLDLAGGGEATEAGVWPQVQPMPAPHASSRAVPLPCTPLGPSFTHASPRQSRFSPARLWSSPG